MGHVSIVGIGQTKVGEHWDSSICELASEAAIKAMSEAPSLRPQAVVVGNMMSGCLNGQEALGAMLADSLGLRAVDCFRVESACASSAAAIRMGYSLIASGQSECVLVVGVEKMTERLPVETTAALAMAMDAETEAIHGATFSALNALIMRLYLEKYGLPHDALAGFSITAHANACHNPNAMFRQAITTEAYSKSALVASPLRVLDIAPACDGAAAVLLVEKALAEKQQRKPIHIRGSASANDRFTLAARSDPLRLQAAELSASRALDLAGLQRDQMDFVEIHDASSIMAALSLEALGFAKPGHGHTLASSPSHRVRYSTLGGLKARGHPVGASGAYQIVDACTQLRGEAGEAQVNDAKLALVQSFGGIASNAFTHVLSRE